MLRSLAVFVVALAALWAVPAHASVLCQDAGANPDGYPQSEGYFWCQQSYHFANTYTWTAPAFATVQPTSFAQWQRTVVCNPDHPSLAPANGQQVVKVGPVGVTFRYQTYQAGGLVWLTQSESGLITCKGPKPSMQAGIIDIWVSAPYSYPVENWWCSIYWEYGGYCGDVYFPAFW